MLRKKKQSTFLMVFRLIGLFVCGLGVAVFVALSQVNLETLRGSILGILRESTGLPVEIDGAISWKFSLRPQIELNDVRIKNADWAKSEYAFDAKRIDVTLDLISLLRSHPTIRNVSINDAKVALERNASGESSMLMNSNQEDVGADKNKDETSEKPKTQQKYLIKKLPFSEIDIHNLSANIDGEKYSIADFEVRYMPRDDKREISGWLKYGIKVFPFIVSFSEYNAERKVYPVSVAFTTGGTPLIVNVALEGTSLMPIDFIIKGDVPDIAAFGHAIGRTWPDLPPMAVNIAGGMGDKKVTLRKSSIAIRGINVDLSGEYDWSKNIPSLVLNLNAGEVVLYKMFPSLLPSGTWVHPDRDLNAFKDTPLYGKELYGMNLQANVKVKSMVVYRELALDDMNINVVSNHGDGRVDINLDFADGDFRIVSDFDIDADGRFYARGAINAENVYIGKILEQVRAYEVVSGLPVNIKAYAIANGRDLSEIMHTITGPVLITANGYGDLRSELTSYIYGKDTLTTIRHNVQDMMTSDKKYDKIGISCATLNVKLRNGVAETENGVAVETGAINARLAGSVDLGNETMKLALTTVPVRGLKVSLSGNVMNSVEITGNLSEPDVKINGLSVASKVASATGLGLLLAPFTGGISVVAGAGIGLVAGDLLENWLADDKPCKTALETGAPAHRDDPEWMNQNIDTLIDSVFNPQE